jgi:TonB-linked SusC/RagA family outer membrane protein
MMKVVYGGGIVVLFTMMLGAGLLFGQDTEKASGHTHLPAELFSNTIISQSQTNEENLFSFEFEETSLNDALQEIAGQGNWKILANSQLIPDSHKVTTELQSVNLFEAFDHVLEHTGLDFIFSGNGYVIIVPEVVEAEQSEPITGTVTDAQTGEPLPGVNIVVEGTTIGTTTNMDGEYELEVPSLEERLIFSFVGYERLTVDIANRIQVNAELTSDVQLMEDVVVVGYGIQERANLSGSLETISGDVLASRPAAQTGQLLQGHSPSMLVSMNMRGGEPGGDQNFQLRGVGSITGDSSPLVLVDGVEMDMNLVEPSSIENITILKDASASAVYGSRAAFGVILIQTKGGGDRPARITYNNITSANIPYYVPDMHDSYTYATVFNQAQTNAGLGPIFGPAQVDRIRGYIDGTYANPYDPEQPPFNHWRGRWDGNANVNWPQEFFTDYSIQQKHTLSIDGGDENTQYYVNMGYQDQPGILNWGNDQYQRYNLLGNVSKRVTDWARFDFSGRYAQTETDRPNGGVWGDRSGYWMHINILWPTMPMYNMDGSLHNPIQVALLDGGRIITNNSNTRFSIGTELEPVSGWTTNISYNYTNRSGTTTNLMHPVETSVADGSTGNIGFAQTGLYEQVRTGHYQVFTAYTQFQRDIRQHYISAMVGYEHDYDFNRWVTGEGYDLASLDAPSISTALGTKEVNDVINHWATQGIFGRLNYNYDERYIFEASARYDGSSRFEEGQRWGLFPSASVAYNISREDFWEPFEPYVQMLRFRASYGSLGNQSLRPPQMFQSGQALVEVFDPNAANYLYLEEIPIHQRLNRIIDGTRPNYADIPAIRSEFLTWETVTTTNVGFEMATLSDRLLLEFDWYHRVTDNMMGPSEQLPSVLGASAPRANNAKLKTVGYELSLAWRDVIGDVFYNARFGLGDNQTTILEYTNETGHVHSWYAGKRYGDVWGLTTDGIIQSENESMPDQSYYHANWGPGDIKYVDLTGDGRVHPGEQTLDDHGDLSVIANTSPRYQVSFSGDVRWRNWDFHMFWQGIGSHPFVPALGSEFYWGKLHGPQSAILVRNSHHLDYWRPADETNILGPNTDAYMPKPYFSTERNKNLQTQTRFVDNARYLRLKNLQVGYSLPLSITQRTPIHTMRIFFSGENLMTLQSLPKAFEPENMIASGTLMRTYPITRMLSLGVNVSF